MQGHLFFNQDDSLRGRLGHVDQRQKWCVKHTNGLSYHVDSRLFGLTASTNEDERPRRQTTVTICDGSCRHFNEVPDEIWNEAKAHLQKSDRAMGMLLPDDQSDIIILTGGYQGA